MDRRQVRPRRDPAGGEAAGNGVAIEPGGEPHVVDEPASRLGAAVRALDAVDPVQGLVVALGDPPARLEQRVQLLELGDPEGRRHLIHPVVEPDPLVDEPVAVVRPALVHEAAQLERDVLVVGRDHPALAGRELLVRVEAVDGRVADASRPCGRRPCTRAPRRRPRRPRRPRPRRSARSPRCRTGSRRCGSGTIARRARRDRRLDCRGVDVQRPLVDVGEDRRGALVEDHVGRGDEREARRDHLVARLEAEAVERDVQARRPTRAGDRGARPDPFGERALERRHHLAARQGVGAEHVHHQLPLTLPDVGASERDRPGRHHAARQTAARTGYSSRSANRSSRPETIAKNVS